MGCPKGRKMMEEEERKRRERETEGVKGDIFEPLDSVIPWSLQLQKPINHAYANTCLR